MKRTLSAYLCMGRVNDIYLVTEFRKGAIFATKRAGLVVSNRDCFKVEPPVLQICSVSTKDERRLLR